MISKKDIIKMAKNVTHRSHGHTERKTINPHREWFIGVTLFIVISVIGGVFNARSHVYYSNLASTVTDTTSPMKKYQRQIADDAKEIYSSRLDAFNSLADDVPIVFVASPTTASTSDEILEVEEIVDDETIEGEDIDDEAIIDVVEEIIQNDEE